MKMKVEGAKEIRASKDSGANAAKTMFSLLFNCEGRTAGQI